MHKYGFDTILIYKIVVYLKKMASSLHTRIQDNMLYNKNDIIKYYRLEYEILYWKRLETVPPSRPIIPSYLGRSYNIRNCNVHFHGFTSLKYKQL